ncbi:MAG: protein translocase subunit SecF [Microthrixaceae bacterium]|nr:protein translocase subunit SecF [Microthrixaceae bacterium]
MASDGDTASPQDAGNEAVGGPGGVSAGPAPDAATPTMSLRKRLYRGTSDIDFPRMFRWTTIVSVLAVVASVVALFTMGLKLSIDFEGGSVWEVPSQDFSAEEAEAVLSAAGVPGGQVQEAETVDGERILRVSGQVESVQQGAELAVDFADAAGLEAGEVTVNTVGPSWGDDITRQARTSLIVFMVLVALYITWRMEARMAVSALVAVIHDILITLGVYSVFQLTITPATVISFLTILGFSLYDTIVVYDRVQENADRLLRSGRYTYTAVMRRSLNQVVMRSINTTITTILPIISMLVVGKFLFGQQTLADFSLALLIGLVLGTYSSLFVASPLTVALKEREARWRDVRARLANRGLDPTDTAWYGVGADAPTRTGARGSSGTGRSSATGAAAVASPATHMGHPPRPRKKKRRS